MCTIPGPGAGSLQVLEGDGHRSLRRVGTAGGGRHGRGSSRGGLRSPAQVGRVTKGLLSYLKILDFTLMAIKSF